MLKRYRRYSNINIYGRKLFAIQTFSLRIYIVYIYILCIRIGIPLAKLRASPCSDIYHYYKTLFKALQTFL